MVLAQISRGKEVGSSSQIQPGDGGEPNIGGGAEVAAHRVNLRAIAVALVVFCSSLALLQFGLGGEWRWVARGNGGDLSSSGRSSRLPGGQARTHGPASGARLDRSDRSARSSLGHPGYSWSEYLKTTHGPTIERIGCGLARSVARHRAPRDALVVLAFGRPMRRHHVFGVSLFGAGFRSTDAVEGAAEAYAQGFWQCSGTIPSVHVEIAVGTSNFGAQVSYGHGRAWAKMVNRASQWVTQHGYESRIGMAGANDIELGWNGPAQTRRWVAGYVSVAQRPYYDFGDAAGCPPRGDCIGSWTVEDVWYVAWGARIALPLPEIYAPNGSSAQEWQRLSLYAFKHHGSAMRIAGVISQQRACRQSADPCRGIDNSPRRAWSLLWRALNSDPRTAQDLRWSTDIRWDR